MDEFRIASGICTGKHDYRFACDTIPNQIWEPTNDSAANLAMDGLIDERTFGETIKDANDFEAKFSAELALLRFVPDLRLGNIQFGSPTNLDLVAQ